MYICTRLDRGVNVACFLGCLGLGIWESRSLGRIAPFRWESSWRFKVGLGLVGTWHLAWWRISLYLLSYYLVVLYV